MARNEATDRRRQQNRDAQRSFRDKRATRVLLLQNDIEATRIAKEAEAAEYERRLDEGRQEIKLLTKKLTEAEQKLQELFQRNQEVETKLHHANIEERFRASGFPNPQVVANNASQPAWPSTPLDSDPIEPDQPETDFTNMFGTGFEKENCGFCKDGGNCACDIIKAQSSKLAPGSCEACQLDPARAEACRSLATQTLPDDGKAEQVIRNDSLATPQTSKRMMSCSTMIDRMGSTGQRASISEIFPGTLHSYGTETGMGYNVNEQEAAQVLQSMSRPNTTVSPTHV